MKAARLYEYDPKMNVQLKIEEVKAPTITAPDEVIVRVGAAGLCRTDLHIIEGVWKPTMDPEGTLLPYIMGHENAGWVEEVGSGVRSVKRGDAVICHPFRSCGICLNCRHGEEAQNKPRLFRAFAFARVGNIINRRQWQVDHRNRQRYNPEGAGKLDRGADAQSLRPVLQPRPDDGACVMNGKCAPEAELRLR